LKQATSLEALRQVEFGKELNLFWQAFGEHFILVNELNESDK
jgi:hypothetical protein